MALAFGSGSLYGRRTDIANSPPVKFATLQEISVDISGTNKELYGQGQFAAAVARGTAKIDCKAKAATISASLYANLFFGTSVAQGGFALVEGESGLVPAAAPYTVAVAQVATWVQDLGVTNAATGATLLQVTGVPAAGEYTVTAGTYTFSAADAGAPLLIDYKAATTTGTSFVITNQQQGIQPVFSVLMKTSYTPPGAPPVQTLLELYACTSSKLSIATKSSDWVIPELDFSAQVNAAGAVGQFSMGA